MFTRIFQKRKDNGQKGFISRKSSGKKSESLRCILSSVRGDLGTSFIFFGLFLFPGALAVSCVGRTELGSPGGQGLPCRLSLCIKRGTTWFIFNTNLILDLWS